LDRDGVSLDTIGVAAQRRLDDIAQEGDELGRAAKRFASRHMLERGADLIRTRTRVSLRFSPRHGPAAFPDLPRNRGIQFDDIPLRTCCFQGTPFARQPYNTCNLTRTDFFDTIYSAKVGKELRTNAGIRLNKQNFPSPS